jgi:hypothetical protein
MYNDFTVHDKKGHLAKHLRYTEKEAVTLDESFGSLEGFQELMDKLFAPDLEKVIISMGINMYASGEGPTAMFRKGIALGILLAERRQVGVKQNKISD